jgi:uncharacterized delta-60 repeat protein
MSRWWIALGLVVALAVTAAHAAPGDLDPGFGSGGAVSAARGRKSGRADDVVVLPDGRILVAVAGHVERYLPNGLADATFGKHGRSRKLRVRAENLAVASDGKIVVGGFAGHYRGAMVGRLTADGQRDDLFGRHGSLDLGVTRYGYTRRIAIDSLGRIVALWVDSEGGITRVLPDGTLDASFGTGGTIITPQIVTAGFVALAIQPDDRILATVYSAVLRWNVDGTPDASFSGDGVTGLQTAPFTPVYGAAIEPLADGRILVAGQQTRFPYTKSDGIALARLLADGSLDTSFGTAGTGYVLTEVGEYAVGTDLALDGDGHIVVAGYAEPDEGPDDDVVVARYDADGSLDAAFGSGGTVMTDLHGPDLTDQATAVAVQADGAIVASGLVFDPLRGGRAAAWLVRYLGS